MTQAEKIDKAMGFVTEAVPASLAITFLAVVVVMFLVDELFSPATARFVIGTIAVVEVLVLVFLAVFAFYLRVYLPLHGV